MLTLFVKTKNTLLQVAPAKIARISGEHVKEQLSIYFTRVEVWFKKVRLAMNNDGKKITFFRKLPEPFSVECIDGDEILKDERRI